MDIRKKLTYQSWHRGTRENDLLLGSFADANLVHFSQEDIAAYSHVLSLEDTDLFEWITGQRPVPTHEAMIQRIRDFHLCR